MIPGEWLNAHYLELWETPTDSRLGGYRIDAWVGGAWTTSALWTFAYDERGNTASEAVQLGDGVGPWQNDERTLFTWDAANRPTRIVEQRGTDSGGWGNRIRRVYTLDAAGNRATHLYQAWDATAGAWVDGDRNTYEHDALGEVTKDTQERWSAETGAWGGLAQRVYAYDAEGRQQERIDRIWEASESGYRNNSRRFISRFVGSHPVELIDQVWIGGGWQGSVRHVGIGDGFTIRVGRFLSSDWAPTWRRELAANGDRLTEEQFLTFSPGPTDKIDRLTLRYDAEGRVAGGHVYNDNGPTKDWSLFEEFACSRDAMGRIVEQSSFLYDAFGPQVYGDREVFTYDADGVIGEIVGQDWDGGGWVNEYCGIAFDLSTDAEAVPVSPGLTVSVTPNPSAGSVRLRLATGTAGVARAEVFDALGRRVARVFEGPVPAGTSEVALSSAGWPPGVYVVRATVDGRAASSRLTVVR